MPRNLVVREGQTLTLDGDPAGEWADSFVEAYQEVSRPGRYRTHFHKQGTPDTPDRSPNQHRRGNSKDRFAKSSQSHERCS